MQLSPNDLSCAGRIINEPVPINPRHSGEEEDLQTAKRVNIRPTPISHTGRPWRKRMVRARHRQRRRGK